MLYSEIWLPALYYDDDNYDDDYNDDDNEDDDYRGLAWWHHLYPGHAHLWYHWPTCTIEKVLVYPLFLVSGDLSLAAELPNYRNG